jgi:DNA-binding PadR family transcriptional regulator
MKLSAPRGLIRLLLLDAASKQPISGTAVSRILESSSQGLWRPGAGSIYFLLNELARKHLLTKLPGKTGSQANYIITSSGTIELEAARNEASGMISNMLLHLALLCDLAGKNDYSEFYRRCLKLHTSSQTDSRVIKAFADASRLLTEFPKPAEEQDHGESG